MPAPITMTRLPLIAGPTPVVNPDTLENCQQTLPDATSRSALS
jgi:hypothetical protein